MPVIKRCSVHNFTSCSFNIIRSSTGREMMLHSIRKNSPASVFISQRFRKHICLSLLIPAYLPFFYYSQNFIFSFYKMWCMRASRSKYRVHYFAFLLFPWVNSFVPRSERNEYLYGFARSQAPQALFNLMQHVIGRLLQQLHTSTVCSVGKFRAVNLKELAV